MMMLMGEDRRWERSIGGVAVTPRRANPSYPSLLRLSIMRQ